MLDKTSGGPTPRQSETKHQRFLRLMQRRLERALEELRLVGQLSSDNYQNTPEEAQEVIGHLDKSVRAIADAFAVPYSTAIGAAAVKRAEATGHLITSAYSTGPVNEIEIVKAMEMIQQGRADEAHALLRDLLLKSRS